MKIKKTSISRSKKKMPRSAVKREEASLSEYQAILAATEEVAQIGSWKWDLRTQKVTWSDEMFRLFGVERENFDGDVNRVIEERIHPEDKAAVEESNRRMLEEANPVPLSYRIILPNGMERTVWAQGKLIRDEEGNSIALTGFVQDITERVRAEKKIIQMKRLYATLSQVNQMIVRVKDHAELYQMMCNVAVQFGEFPFAWVGLLDEASGDVRPVAASGEDLEQWKFPIVNLHNENHYHTLTATALRTSQVVSTKDIQVDARAALLRHSMPQVPYHGMAAIPFQVRKKPLGVFVIFSYEFDLFDQTDEISLLNEMSLDVSFALDNMENEKERQRAEQKIAYQARLLENINDAVLATDAQLRITSWNRTAEALYGYKENEVLGRPSQEIIRSEFSDEQRVDAMKTLQENGSFRVEVIQYHRDGHSFWVEGSTFALRDQNGQVDGYISINRDITDRKHAEEELQQSQERYRLISENSADVIWVLDPVAGKFTYVSPSVEKLRGFTPAEVMAQPVADALTPESLKLVSDGLAEKLPGFIAKGSGTLININEVDQPRKDGSIVHTEVTTTYAFNQLGQVEIVGISRDITERKKVEQTLRESEARFAKIFHSSPTGINIFRLTDGRSIDVNDTFLKIIGYSREEILQHSAAELNLFVDMEARNHWMKQLFAGEAVHNQDTKIRRKTGEVRDVLASLDLTELNGEKVVLVIATDITDRKQVEEALKRNEHVLRLFVEHSPASIAMFDRDMKYIVASHRYLIDYHLPIQDLTGRSHYEVFPEVPERWKEIHRRCLTGAIEKAEEAPFPRDDGTMDWVRWEIRPWYEEAGAIGGIILFSEVITERKQAEELVRNRNRMLLTLHQVALQVGSELRLPNLLANVLGEAQSLLNADRGGGVYLYDPDTQSLRLAHGTGINRGRDGITVQIGTGVAGHVYQTAQPFIVDDYTNWEGHATILVQDPPSTVMGVPLFAENKVIGVLTFIANSKFRKFKAMDVQQAEMFAAQVAIAIQNAQLYHQAQNEIIERTKAQDELHLLNAQLEQRVIERTAELQRANRAKDEFLANMSHELRTPLNTVLGLSESLLEQRKGPLNEKQAQSLELISSSGRHLLGLINDILEVSKIEAGKLLLSPTTVSVKELCESSLNFIKEMAIKKSIDVEFVNAQNIVTLHADPQRIKQILINLLMNAIKFTPEHGRVSLKVFTNEEKDKAGFSVTDTGIGIAKEDLQKLFKPFTQLDSSLARQYAGTGLGLALVQKLTDLHGGSVHIESELGKGSCFTIYLPWKTDLQPQTDLPVLSKASLTESDQGSSSMGSPHGRQVILLAEDNESNIITIGEYLDASGYYIVVAHDGFEAIEKAKVINPDIILMDIQMPAMNGLEAMRLLRADARFTNTPIIALTALAMPGDRERCLSAGADEYMSKPVSLRELTQTIKRLLRSEQ
ncbi:MAG: PAS domain S-box protein [Anaerolineales bacterium]